MIIISTRKKIELEKKNNIPLIIKEYTRICTLFFMLKTLFVA